MAEEAPPPPPPPPPSREMTPLELMRHRNDLMHSAESIHAGRSFAPRPTDVFIVTYPKCGTTWATQVCHQIRCIASNASCAAKHAAAMGGPASGATARAHVVDAMAFGEITQVVPWDILALDCGQRLDDEQVCDPRLFKSHERWENVAKGARYVCVVRDPLDVFFSFYNFLPAYMGIAPGKITHEEFADAIFAGASHSGHVWAHFLGYWEQRAREDVLLVCFEDMKENLARVVERVARFILGDGNGNGDGNAASASAFEWTSAMTDEVCEKSEFEYMRSRAAQFDDHFVREEMWRRVRIDENEWGGDKLVGKVREGGGKVGGGKEGMSAELRERIEKRWDEVMRPAGFEAYADFRAAINALYR